MKPGALHSRLYELCVYSGVAGGALYFIVKYARKDSAQRDVFPAIEYGILGMGVGGIRGIKVSPHLTYYEGKIKPELPRASGEWDYTIGRNGR